MGFFLNIFRKKRIRPFWRSAALSTFCRFSCALKANRIYLWNLFSAILHCFQILFVAFPQYIFGREWSFIILQICELQCPWAPYFNSLFWELAENPQDGFRLYSGSGGQAEPVVNFSSWWKLEWPVPVPTPRATLSWVPPLPIHPQDKLQPVRNRRLKVLILQVGRLLVKRLEWRTRAPGDEEWVRFRNLSRSHCIPSTGFPMHFFSVRRFPWTWRFGTHRMGTTHYYFKG